MRLGLGKAEEDRQYTAAENVVRKRLEVEIQADEDAARTQRREVGTARYVLHNFGGIGSSILDFTEILHIQAGKQYIISSVPKGQQTVRNDCALH